MVVLTSSCSQFCFRGGERFTSFCYICKVVANAYSTVCKVFVPKMSLTGEYENPFLSYVAPYFLYKTAYEIILLDTQSLYCGGGGGILQNCSFGAHIS